MQRHRKHVTEAQLQPKAVRVIETNPTHQPPCVQCIDEGGEMSPHKAAFELRNDAGTLITYACDRSIAGAIVQAYRQMLPIVAAALLMFGCSSGSSSSDAGDVDAAAAEDGGQWVGLIDSGEDLEDLDAGGDAGEQLEHDAGDVDAAEDLDAGDVDAGELEHDAGDVDAAELEPCALERELRACHAFGSCSTLCQVGTNTSCCDGTAGELELCACEVSP